jgi:hypothetical protein
MNSTHAHVQFNLRFGTVKIKSRSAITRVGLESENVKFIRKIDKIEIVDENS